MQLEDELLIRGEKCYGQPEGWPLYLSRLEIGLVSWIRSVRDKIRIRSLLKGQVIPSI
jgi:hypothetical protein